MIWRCTRWPSPALLLVALPFLAGCAVWRGGRGGHPTQQAQIEVENNLIPPAAITVRISGIGRSVLLGDVRPGATGILSYRDAVFRGQYNLEASASAHGVHVTSPPFSLRAGDRIFWDVNNNLVRARDDPMEPSGTPAPKLPQRAH